MNGHLQREPAELDYIVSREICEEIVADHTRIAAFFDQLQFDVDSRDLLLPMLKDLLLAHIAAMEEILPAVRTDPKAPALIADQEQRDARICEALKQLQFLVPDSLDFDELLQRLIDLVMLGVDDEVELVMPVFADLSESRQIELGRKFALARSARLSMTSIRAGGGFGSRGRR